MQKEGLSAPLAIAAPSLDVVKLAPEAHSGSSTDDVVAILPKHTKVLVTGNNRTKRSLMGQEAVVKKAVGLGGWHWLVCETLAKLRNAWTGPQAAAAGYSKALPLGIWFRSLCYWHLQVLRNGEEVKLQRNALQVIEYGPDEMQVGPMAALYGLVARGRGLKWS
jgi:hypothetical protein